MKTSKETKTNVSTKAFGNEKQQRFWFSHPYLFFMIWSNLLVLVWLLFQLPWKGLSSYHTWRTIAFLYAMGYPISFALFEHRKKKARLKNKNLEKADQA